MALTSRNTTAIESPARPSNLDPANHGQCIHKLPVIWLHYQAIVWRSLPRAKQIRTHRLQASGGPPTSSNGSSTAFAPGASAIGGRSEEAHRETENRANLGGRAGRDGGV
jgi:hypothetical protein